MKISTTYFMLLFTSSIFISCNSNSKTSEDVDQSTDTTVTTTTTTTTETKSDSNNIKTETITKQSETITQHFDYTGVMMMKGGSWVIRVTDAQNSVTDYFPKNLTNTYQVEGMKVRFSGTVEEIPKNVRMVGRPITLSIIEQVK